MKNLILFALFVWGITACTSVPEQKVKVYGWEGEGANTTEQTLHDMFAKLKEKGLSGIMYNAGNNIEKHRRAAKAAKEAGLEYHAWIPTMAQGGSGLDSSFYVVNRNGESAFNKPAYVAHYKFLCPNHEETYTFLHNIYSQVAAIPEVDAVHLDYIRFPDVILARGLWDKYGLVMDEEYAPADYCYCDKCVADFKAKTGIDIKGVDDPSKCPEWVQFRCDLITNFVNRLAADIHAQGKKIDAAVFPGPTSQARKLVRQEWNKWDLDAFYPMNYNDFYLEGPDWVGEVVNEEVTSVNGEKPVFSGLFICGQPEKKAQIKDPEGHGLLPSEIEEAVRGAMENGAAGICLFTPSHMTDAHWEALDRAVRRDYTKNAVKGE